jgi:uncharacterized protein
MIPAGLGHLAIGRRMRIGITGATGLIGKAVGSIAVASGHQVVAYSRQGAKTPLPFPAERRFVDTSADLPLDPSGLDVLIHLAGESILGYWTSRRKDRIRDSRVHLTQGIVRCLAADPGPPIALLSGSAVGYYGDCGDVVLDESSPPGQDFLAQLCVDWEAAALRAQGTGSRVVLLRTGLVLGAAGGAWPLLRRVFACGLGGRLGKGQHWQPWIHLDDVAAMILWAAENPKVTGPINLVSPNPVQNGNLTRDLGSRLRRPAFMHVPAVALRLVLGEFGQMLLSSQRALPKKSCNDGFHFAYPNHASAISALLRQ